MYKIKNITRGKLLLGDLGIKLDSGEIIDLDSIHSRAKIEASNNLKVAEGNELVAVLHKDVINASPTNFIDPSILSAMEKRIRDQIAQQMQTQSVAPQIENVAELTAKLSELITKMGESKSNSQSVGVEELPLDDDVLRAVHEKSIRRMTHGMSGHVKAKETNQSSEAVKNADELDNLLH